uniref:Carcinoembryonic antigen-related cell adhesion molecule 16-like isoform X2 n=1 Tax=Phascolarctos cinereus TaxID=38626 RepID=A0A6P5LRP3_PHACI|nr:carcinoembryonic antigen-related cell adhesion molecule 16-like isoform X2 [Phascolarctos cinereus]
MSETERNMADIYLVLLLGLSDGETEVRRRCEGPKVTRQAVLLASMAAAELLLFPEDLNRLPGSSIRWRISGGPSGYVNYTWYRANASIEANMLVSYISSPPSWIPGPANAGWENVTQKGYLTITELEFGDAGNYSIVVTGIEGSQEDTGQIQVWGDEAAENLGFSKEKLKE